MKENHSAREAIDKADSLGNSIIVPIIRGTCANKENSISKLDSLKREERKLRVERRQLLDTLKELQSKFDVIYEKKRVLLAETKRDIVCKQNNESESKHKLFSIATWGSSWTDGLVFTVMAETEVWARELVRQWLESNGRGNHRIDKVMALVSRDVRAIVNVGAILLDV